MLSKYEYEKLAEEISDDFINEKKPLNESIKIVSIKMELNPEQIKRLTESSNIKTYNKMYDKLEDKTFTFDLGDSKKVIDEVYSEKNDPVEIKDMSPVEFKADEKTKAPEIVEESIGDDDELEVSKNTMTNEDSASDTMLDALKVPKKDYSYDDEDEVEDEKEEVVVEIEDEEEEDEEDEKEKTASFDDYSSDIKQELERRSMLLATDLLDSIKKTASLFRGSDKNTKFAELVKNASILHSDNENLSPVLDILIKEANIDRSITTKVSVFNKLASKNSIGMSQLNDLLDTYEAYTRVEKTLNTL